MSGNGRGGAPCRQFSARGKANLMVDDYSGYKASFNAKKTVEPCIKWGYWTPARRKFFDMHKANQSPMAEEALVRMSAVCFD